MLLQRQQLQDHLKECIHKAHKSHIQFATPPIGYLECTLHAHEKDFPPHIQLDKLTPFDKFICPKSPNCEVVPWETYALLFVPSLTTSKFI